MSELRRRRSCFAARDRRREADCRHCGTARPLHPEAIAPAQLQACPWCMTTDLYIQKDFPQGLGLFIVVVGFAISTVFWYYEMPIPAYLVLVVSMLLDLVMYHLVPDVTICYRCLCQLRGAGSNPGGRYQAVRPGRRRTVPAGANPRPAVARARGTGGVKGRHAAVARGLHAGRPTGASRWQPRRLSYRARSTVSACRLALDVASGRS